MHHPPQPAPHFICLKGEAQASLNLTSARVCIQKEPEVGKGKVGWTGEVLASTLPRLTVLGSSAHPGAGAFGGASAEGGQFSGRRGPCSCRGVAGTVDHCGGAHRGLGSSGHLLPLRFADPETALLLLPTWTAVQLSCIFFFF